MYGLTPYPTHDPVNSRLLRHLCTAKKIEQPQLPANRTEKQENRGVSTILFVVVDASYHKGIAVYFTTTFLAYGDSETLVGPQSRFEVNPLKSPSRLSRKRDCGPKWVTYPFWNCSPHCRNETLQELKVKYMLLNSGEVRQVSREELPKIVVIPFIFYQKLRSRHLPTIGRVLADRLIDVPHST